MPKIKDTARPLKIGSSRMKKAPIMAARPVRAIGWARTTLGWESVETHMNDTNAAARLLAERLGGSIIARKHFPDGLSRNVYALHPSRES